MKMMKKMLSLALIIAMTLSLSVITQASEEENPKGKNVALGKDYWFTEPQGRSRVDDSRINNSDISITDGNFDGSRWININGTYEFDVVVDLGQNIL